MKYFQLKYYSLFALLLLTFLSCKTKEVANIVDDSSWFAKNGELSKHFDVESNTTYYLTRIKHKDSNGKLIKLRMAVSNRKEGESVQGFAKRVN